MPRQQFHEAVESGFKTSKEGCLPQRGVDDHGLAVRDPTLDIVELASTAEGEEGFRSLAKLYFTENGDLRSILADLSLIERIRVRVQVAAQIKDAKKRDDALSGIVSELGKAAPKSPRKAAAK